MGDIVERLLDFQTRDHERGCTGREYVCSCGYDADFEAAAKKAADEILRLRRERSEARNNALEMAAKVADAAANGRRSQQADALIDHRNKEARDFESMKFEAIEIAAAIRKLKETGQ